METTNKQKSTARAVVSLLLILVLGAAAGFFGRPMFDSWNKSHSAGGKTEASSSSALATPPTNPMINDLKAKIFSIGEIRRAVNDSLSALNSEIVLTQRSLITSIRYEKRDPNSPECKVLGEEIANLSGQKERLSTINAKLESYDFGLRRAITLINSKGTIQASPEISPEMMNAIGETEQLLERYDASEKVQEMIAKVRDGVISTEDWMAELKKDSKAPASSN